LKKMPKRYSRDEAFDSDWRWRGFHREQRAFLLLLRQFLLRLSLRDCGCGGDDVDDVDDDDDDEDDEDDWGDEEEHDRPRRPSL
jgi:hypothetical protein